MPLEKTITIVNNSGKIISTGKQLLSVFTQAKGAYQEKKAQIKSERTIQRAQTFHHDTRSVHRPHDRYEPEPYYDEDEYYDKYYDKYYEEDAPMRPSRHDGHSEAGSRRSHRSRSVTSKRNSPKDGRDTRNRPALTMNNLKTHSEVSSQAPSRPPVTYRSPYAETMGRDMGVSRMDVAHADMRSVASSRRGTNTMVPRRRSMSQVGSRYKGEADSYYEERGRPNYDGHVGAYHGDRSHHRGKDIDMDLAYGSMPPDLEHRTDLEPLMDGEAKENRAKMLVMKVEGLLVEAHCAQAGATATIKHLQQNPDAAAAVALTLAELSTVVTKMSPALLGFLKGGSPAVFALLASPQFLIGTGIAAGVTVVMFGGWKIVQKIKEQHAAREALAYEGVPMHRPAPMRTQSDFGKSMSMDEALVVEDDEVSTIETWRRGIAPFGDDESVDMELITPTADRATRAHRRQEDEFDLKSRRSTRTTKTSKTSSSKKKEESSERKSSRQATAESVAGSERSRRSSTKKKAKTIEDGRSQRAEEEQFDMVFRPKAQRQGSNMLKAMFKSKKDKTEMVRV